MLVRFVTFYVYHDVFLYLIIMALGHFQNALKNKKNQQTHDETKTKRGWILYYIVNLSVVFVLWFSCHLGWLILLICRTFWKWLNVSYIYFFIWKSVDIRIKCAGFLFDIYEVNPTSNHFFSAKSSSCKMLHVQRSFAFITITYWFSKNQT